MKKKLLSMMLTFFFLTVIILFFLVLVTRNQSIYSEVIYAKNYLHIRNKPIIIIDKNFVKTFILTEINYDNINYQILAYEINPNKKIRVLLTASVHGEEPAGAFALSELINQAEIYVKKYPYITIDVIPIMNPWGYSTDTRYNYNGVNIGVDFTIQKTIEAESIIKYLKNKKYECIIDLHENPSKKNYILIYDLSNIKFVKTIVDDLNESGYLIATTPTIKPFQFINNDKGIAYYPKFTLFLQQIASRETLFVWLKNRGICKTVYAFESGSQNNIQTRKDIDIKIIEKILDNIIEVK